MAKQTFTTGQVLTAAQMTSLQQTAMGGGSPSVKTVSYVLVAADAGTTIQMNSASATTITVNTALFAAGDSVFIQNIGAGVCTITAGTATVTTSGLLALSQWEGGQLFFTSASASIFFDYTQSAAAGGKVLQVVQATTTTTTTINSGTYTDSGLSATITPTLNTSKVLVLVSQPAKVGIRASTNELQYRANYKLLRGSTDIAEMLLSLGITGSASSGLWESYSIANVNYLDSPATTSATTYKTQGSGGTNSGVIFQGSSGIGTMILLEIGA